MGIAFGRTAKDRGKTPKKRTSHFLPERSHSIRYWLNTSSDEIRCLYEGSVRGRELLRELEMTEIMGTAERPAHSPHSPLIPFSLADCPSLLGFDRFLFHYFSHTCTIRKSLIDGDNPWKSVVLPLCYQSEGLLQMGTAWAAHILRNQCSERDVDRYDQLILTHKCRSLGYLRNMVPQYAGDEAISIAQTKSERDAVLLLVMFHCLLEIASGSVKEWTYHMRGALWIIKFYTSRDGRDGNAFSHEVLELVYSFFLERVTFFGTSTAGGEEGKYQDLLGWWAEVPAIFPFLTGRDCMKVDPCMGLSPELLDIISSISTLSRTRHTRNITLESISLQHRLKRLEAFSAGRERETDMSGTFLHTQAFQSAAWIYLHHALASQPHHSPIIQETHLPRLLSTLAQIHQLHGPLLAFLPYPMWALFIASCVVLEEDRVLILEWFEALNCKKPVSNVPSTLAAVKAIWKKRDLESEELYNRSGDLGIAACKPVWMAAIEELGWQMPFT
ncbi:fungal-specific transcription factor domain-containing protein [Aspergillus venezuelensis]